MSLGLGAGNKRRSRLASSMAAMAGQSSRAATARPTYLVTTPLGMPNAVAICWCDCWPSNLRRRASLSLRMLILGAGIAVLQKGWTLTRPEYEIHAQHRADVVDRRAGHDDRNRWSRSRNQRSRSTGITGHVAPEYPIKHFEQPKLNNSFVLKSEINEGIDELGVLLLSDKFPSTWLGSQMSIEKARSLAPYNNATSLQVVGSVMAALKWIERNPNEGLVESEYLDHQFIFDHAREYWEPIKLEFKKWHPSGDMNNNSWTIDQFIKFN